MILSSLSFLTIVASSSALSVQHLAAKADTTGFHAESMDSGGSLPVSSLGFEQDLARTVHAIKYKVEETSDTLRSKLSDAKAKVVHADILGQNEPVYNVNEAEEYDPYETSNIKYYRGMAQEKKKRSVAVADTKLVPSTLHTNGHKLQYPRARNYSQVIYNYEHSYN